MKEGRILAFDYGIKRTGVAVSDPEKKFSFPLTTVATHQLFQWLEDYMKKNSVCQIVIGLPLHADYTPADIEPHIQGFIRKIKKHYPDIPVARVDERFTSVLAQQTIIQAGVSKRKRQDKSLLDKISAALILQTYLEQLQKTENTHL